MDSFIGLAKQGYAKYEESQNQQGNQGGQQGNNFQQTGGAHLNAPSHGYGGSQQGGLPDLHDDDVVNTAAEHGAGDNDLFAQGLNFVKGQMGSSNSHVDEDHVQNAHAQAYDKGNAGSLDAGALGSAAALQALKNFTSGSGNTTSASSGGDMKSKLIGMAMAEASKLYESQGAASGNKQDAVNGAAATVMKLLVKSQFSSAIGGGGSSGIMGLASKFM